VDSGNGTGRPAGGRRAPLLTREQATGLAESLWGTGGTASDRTNRDGAFCFSCSAHGGFVIDDRALTGRERDLLTEAGFAAVACWGIRGADGGIIAVRHPRPQDQQQQRVIYQPRRGEYEDRNIPVWTFEEDAEQAAVYALTGIRPLDTRGGQPADAEVVARATEILARWYPRAAEVAVRAAREPGGTAGHSQAAAPAGRRRPAGGSARQQGRGGTRPPAP